MKKTISIIIILILIAISYYHYGKDTILPDMLENDISNRIDKRIGNNISSPNDKVIEIQNYKFDKSHIYVLFTNNQSIGFAIYKKTFLNRYSCIKIGQTSAFYTYDFYKDNNSFVATVIGRDTYDKIEYFIINTDNGDIKEYVNSKYFIYQYDLSVSDFDIIDIRFYDKNDNDVTRELLNFIKNVKNINNNINFSK